VRQECSNEEQDQSAAPVGRELAAARARRGYTLRQLSELTRIPESVLHAWEHGDTACGPAERYRAQVRTLCAVLDLDPAALLCRGDPGQAPVRRRTAPSRGGQWGWVAVVIAAALTLAVLAWPGRPFTPDHPEAFPAAGQSPAGSPSAPDPASSAAPAVPPTAGQVTLRVTAHRPTWVSVTDGTDMLFTGVLAAGQTRDWTADEVIHLRLADAGGVHLWVNGHAYGVPGADGEVTHLTYTAQSGSPR
jgi:cytoskeleton protein RodZ